MQRVLGGDRHAVQVFVERMRCVARLLSYQNRRLGHPLPPEELEDVAQDTVTVIWRKLAQYQGDAGLETWVYRFCYLELVARVRTAGRRPRFLEELSGDQENDALSVNDEEPARHERVYRALELLGDPGAGLLRCKHLEGRTFEEIAADLGLSVNTLKARYYRALPRFRELLERLEDEVEP